MFEELNQHRAAVAENIQKACEIGFTGNELEKAHKVGDVHPNGKWVWTQLPSGKYDWRVIKKTSAPSSGSAPATAQKPKKEEEIKGFINILKRKPNERHFEIMDDAELKRFRDVAHKCWLDDENLNRSTRIQCRDWRDLAKQELEYRAKEKSGGEKKEFKIGSQITKENVEDFADRINRGELHVVYTYGKSQNYVVKKAAKPYNENGKTKVQLTFQYIGNDKNNADYPDGTQVDDWKIEELNDSISRGKITVARKNGSVKKTNEKHKETKAAKVPSGHRIHYEDDLVEVYDDKGKKVYSGLFDYCDYKDENYKWNEKDKNYDLPHGYKLVGKTKH